MKFIPLYERVLVQPMETAKSVDGFALPDNARDDFLMGVVVSAGDGYAKEDGTVRRLRVKPGMTVLFGPYAGTKVQINSQELLSMREAEIVGWLCFKDEGKPCGACPDCIEEPNERPSPDREAEGTAGVCAAAGKPEEIPGSVPREQL